IVALGVAAGGVRVVKGAQAGSAGGAAGPLHRHLGDSVGAGQVGAVLESVVSIRLDYVAVLRLVIGIRNLQVRERCRAEGQPETARVAGGVIAVVLGVERGAGGVLDFDSFQIAIGAIGLAAAVVEIAGLANDESGSVGATQGDVGELERRAGVGIVVGIENGAAEAGQLDFLDFAIIGVLQVGDVDDVGVVAVGIDDLLELAAHGLGAGEVIKDETAAGGVRDGELVDVAIEGELVLDEDELGQVGAPFADAREVADVGAGRNYGDLVVAAVGDLFDVRQ